MITLVSTTRSSTAPPSAFFHRWVDHSTWPEWSTDTLWARVEGTVGVGTRGTLKPRGGPRTRFVISECAPDEVYTDVSSFPGATLEFRHTAKGTEAGTSLGVAVSMQGPLAWFWARTACRGLAKSAPADLDRLIALAEAA